MPSNLTEASLAFIVQLIMRDLQHYIENDDTAFTTETYNDISTWIEWIDEQITSEECEILSNELHEMLGEMRIWADDGNSHEQQFISKIKEYYISKYERTPGLDYLIDLTVKTYINA